MATKINKKDRNLGFDSDTFELIVRKPKENSVWFEVGLKAGKNEIDSLFRSDHVAEKLAARLKSTVESFIDSSFDALILVGKVVNENK